MFDSPEYSDSVQENQVQSPAPESVHDPVALLDEGRLKQIVESPVSLPVGLTPADQVLMAAGDVTGFTLTILPPQGPRARESWVNQTRGVPAKSILPPDSAETGGRVPKGV